MKDRKITFRVTQEEYTLIDENEKNLKQGSHMEADGICLPI